MFSAPILLSVFLGQAEPTAEQLFEKMKAKLFGAQTVECALFLKLKVKLNGEMQLKAAVWLRVPENKVSVQLKGVDSSIKLGSIADGKTAAYRNGWSLAKTAPPAKDLAQRVVAALTYSGLPAAFPLFLDAEKSAAVELQGFFKLKDFKLGNAEFVGAIPAHRISYTLLIKGQDEPYKVTLWIEKDTLLPIKRTATGNFGSTAATVTETYNKLALDEPVADKHFVIPKTWTTPPRDATPEEKYKLPSPDDLVGIQCDPFNPPGGTATPKMSAVALNDIKYVLKNYQIIPYKNWLSDYSHIALCDRTGTVSLKNGESMYFMLRPGGLAILMLADNTRFYLVNKD